MPLVLDPIQSGYNLSKINDNFQRIEDTWDEKLDRIAPAAMEAQLDMNSNRVINHPNARIGDPLNTRDLVLVEDITQLGSFDGVIPTVDSYVGDGSRISFPFSSIVTDVRAVGVYIGGLRQEPITDYTLIGNNVVFVTAPASAAPIDIYAYNPVILENGAPVYAEPFHDTFTGDGLTDTFSIPASGAGTLEAMCYIDGIKQNPFTDYESINGVTTFTVAPTVGSQIDITIWAPFSVNADNSVVTADGSDFGRDLSERFTDTVNVKDFGVIGDGVADDSAAFLLALASSEKLKISRGTTVRIVNTTVNIPSNASFYGGGKIILDNSPLQALMTSNTSTTLGVDMVIGGFNVEFTSTVGFTEGDYVHFDNLKPRWNLNPGGAFDYEEVTKPWIMETYGAEVKRILRITGNTVEFDTPFSIYYDDATTTITQVDVVENITFEDIEIEYVNSTYPCAHFRGCPSLRMENVRMNLGFLSEFVNDSEFNNCKVTPTTNVGNELTSVQFFSGKRNKITNNTIVHVDGDAGLLIYRNSTDNIIQGNVISSTDDQFPHGILMYDICNRNVVDGNTIRGGNNGISVYGYCRGSVISNNAITINYLRTGNRWFSRGIYLNCTADVVVDSNTISSASHPDYNYNFLGIDLSGVTGSSVTDNNLTNCIVYGAPKVRFQGYANAEEKGVEYTAISGNTMRSYMTRASAFEQNVIDQAAVVDPAYIANQNVSPALMGRYGIKLHHPEKGVIVTNNTMVGWNCAIFFEELDGTDTERMVKGNNFQDCGIGILFGNDSKSPATSTVNLGISDNTFYDVYNAVGVFYFAGTSITQNSFHTCHNLVNYIGTSTAWKGHGFSATAFNDNTYKKYYNIFINGETHNILNSNVAKLPDGSKIRFENNYLSPVDREYLLSGNDVPNEALPVTKIRRNVSEFQE